MVSKLSLGRQGEDIAEKYLRNQGYKILEKNFHKRYCELDIVAMENNILVFIEVKTRIGNKYGLPREAITPMKLKTLIRSVNYYKLLHPELPGSMRIDFVGISLDESYNTEKIELIKNISQ